MNDTRYSVKEKITKGLTCTLYEYHYHDGSSDALFVERGAITDLYDSMQKLKNELLKSLGLPPRGLR